MKERIELGDIARDTVTGFQGTVVADTQGLHGCRRLSIQPNELREGKPIDSLSFDELQLELVSKKAHVPVVNTGGPRPEPVRR